MIFTENDTERLKEAVDIMFNAVETFGEDRQTDKAIEEMSELVKELLKYRYATDEQEQMKRAANISEKVADVLITVGQLYLLHGDDELIRKKIIRLAGLVEIEKEAREDG